MKKYQFRATYLKEKENGDIEYRSIPISEAKEQYDTVGIYELSEKVEDIEKMHIADIPREDFKLILDSRFPNGFESWQKSHHEITLIINKEKYDKQTNSVIAQLTEFREKSICHSLALYITNEFEAYQKEKPVKAECLSDEIKNFLESHDFKLLEILIHIL